MATATPSPLPYGADYDGEPNVATCRRIEKYARDVFNFIWKVTYDGSVYGVVEEEGQPLGRFVVLGKSYSSARTKTHIIADEVPDANQPAFVTRPAKVRLPEELILEPGERLCEVVLMPDEEGGITSGVSYVKVQDTAMTDLQRRDAAMKALLSRLTTARTWLETNGVLLDVHSEVWDALKPGRWIHYALADLEPLVLRAEDEVRRAEKYIRMAAAAAEKERQEAPAERPSVAVREAVAAARTRALKPVDGEMTKEERVALRPTLDVAVLAAFNVGQVLTVPEILDAVLAAAGLLRRAKRKDAHYEVWTSCCRLQKAGKLKIDKLKGGCEMSLPASGSPSRKYYVGELDSPTFLSYTQRVPDRRTT